jgi:hypothetical protein
MEAPSGPPCAFYLTGFGLFSGCPGDNPSAALAAALAAPPPGAAPPSSAPRSTRSWRGAPRRAAAA